VWDFETDPEYQEKLDWRTASCAKRSSPRYVVAHPLDLSDPVRQALIPPLQDEVRAHGLWACHLGPELGGPGYGQVKLALLNEILGARGPARRSGRSFSVARRPIPAMPRSSPITGRRRTRRSTSSRSPRRQDLLLLLDDRAPGGSDPKVFRTEAVLDGDEWVLNGEKWFSSNARWAEFLIVMAITDPENEPYQRMSMFIVPTDTPGVRILRDVGRGGLGGRRRGGPRVHPL